MCYTADTPFLARRTCLLILRYQLNFSNRQTLCSTINTKKNNLFSVLYDKTLSCTVDNNNRRHLQNLQKSFMVHRLVILFKKIAYRYLFLSHVVDGSLFIERQMNGGRNLSTAIPPYFLTRYGNLDYGTLTVARLQYLCA